MIVYGKNVFNETDPKTIRRVKLSSNFKTIFLILGQHDKYSKSNNSSLEDTVLSVMLPSNVIHYLSLVNKKRRTRLLFTGTGLGFCSHKETKQRNPERDLCAGKCCQISAYDRHKICLDGIGREQTREPILE